VNFELGTITFPYRLFWHIYASDKTCYEQKTNCAGILSEFVSEKNLQTEIKDFNFKTRMQLVYHPPPSEDDLQPAGMDNLTSALDESMDPEKEDYEVFDKRDLMNVVVHSVLCAGITQTPFLQQCAVEEFFKFRKNRMLSIMCQACLFKGTVRPDWICMRVLPLESPLKGYQPLNVFDFLISVLNI
jgi:hypothetical protein